MPEDDKDDIMIISENITKKPDKVFRQPKSRLRPSAAQYHAPVGGGGGQPQANVIMGQPPLTQFAAGQAAAQSAAAGVPAAASVGAPPMAAVNVQPYANTLVQYGGYHYQPSLLAPTLVQPVVAGGGYFAVPSVQPIAMPQPAAAAFLQPPGASVLQPTIYYNNLQYSVRPGQIIQQQPPAGIYAYPGGGTVAAGPIAPQPMPIVSSSPAAVVGQSSAAVVTPVSQQPFIPGPPVLKTEKPIAPKPIAATAASGKQAAQQSDLQILSHSVGGSAPPPKKIARVQPTPHVVRPIPKKLTSPVATAVPSSSAGDRFQQPQAAAGATVRRPAFSPALLSGPQLPTSSFPATDKPINLSQPEKPGPGFTVKRESTSFDTTKSFSTTKTVCSTTFGNDSGALNLSLTRPSPALKSPSFVAPDAKKRWIGTPAAETETIDVVSEEEEEGDYPSSSPRLV